jgi:hypothetical protein
MKNRRTMRTLLLPGLTIITLLVVVSVQGPFLPPGMAMEAGGASHAGVPHPKGKVFYVSGAGNALGSDHLRASETRIGNSE